MQPVRRKGRKEKDEERSQDIKPQDKTRKRCRNDDFRGAKKEP
jgi:hypothetical protein